MCSYGSPDEFKSYPDINIFKTVKIQESAFLLTPLHLPT